MSRPIQALAPAFLNLLGLKNQGALPPDLVDLVQPQVDMLGFYLRGGALGTVNFANSPFPVAAWVNGGIATFTIPTNEYWFIHHLTGRLACSALPNNKSDIVNLRAYWSTPNPGVIAVGDAAPINRTAASALNTYWTAPSVSGIWIPPGGAFGLYADLIDVSDLTPVQVWGVETYCRYTPIPV